MTSRAWAVSALVSLPFFPLAMHGPNVLALLTPRNAGEVKSFTPDSQIGLNGRLRPAAGQSVPDEQHDRSPSFEQFAQSTCVCACSKNWAPPTGHPLRSGPVHG